MKKYANAGKFSLGALAVAVLGAGPVALLFAAPGAPRAAAVPAAPTAAGGRAAVVPSPLIPAGLPASPVLKPATTEALGGGERFLTFVETDKPVYRASEKVYVRAVLLNAATHLPLGENQNAQALVQILGPRGEVVSSGGMTSQNSVVAFGWTVPDSSAGGEYTFKITYPNNGYTPAERKFDVRVYRAPRLKSQVKFVRDGYGPGDKVTASLHTERAEGGFPAGAKVTVTARVDDRQVFSGPATVDAKGDCSATFDLPKAMERGEGTLAFAIEDGGVVETAGKTIPILMQTVDLNVYPEGGDAISGVPNRFYIEAKTPAKKPADLVGQIVDSKGKKIADVKTEHEGRGRFEFTPAKGETYTLKLTEPAGIVKTWTLPAAKETGVVIHTADDIVAKDQTVKFNILGADVAKGFLDGTLKVTLTKHETDVVASQMFMGQGNGQGVSGGITLKPDTDGVLTLTVWNGKGEPLAERLIYRQPAHGVNVQVKADQSTYTPGGKVTLNILTTDETGEPIPANVGLTVTDDSVLEMIEKREQAPRLPVMVMLEPEVKELADAQIYLDSTNPKAALATDLLLGTQGWRRFALVNAAEFMTKYGDDASRALAFKKTVEVGPQGQVGGGGIGGGLGGAGGRRGAGPALNAALPEPLAAPRFAAAKEAPPAFGLDAEKMGQDQRKAAEVLDGPANKQLADKLEMADQGMAVGEAGGFGGGGGRGGGRGGRGRGGGFIAQGSLIAVRQFAHDLRPGWSPADRSDFIETVYWNANITTDSGGHATTTFALSDSVTSFRAFADAFNKNGALGSSSSTVQSIQPFFIEPKLPLEVTAGDVIELPISAVNNTQNAFKDFTLTLSAPENLKITPPAPSGTLAPTERIRKIYKIAVGDVTGDMDLTISATAGQFVDRVTRKLRVKPKGFPTSLAYGGLLDSTSPAKKEFIVPPSMVRNSMQTFATVYPSPVANLTDAVAALLREPGGCFEQTSSTNYPMAMAQMYFHSHQGVDPQLQAKAIELLTHGYQRLTSFECKDKGYEWFGGSAPGHEALTAYGLMEFHDMQEGGLALVDDKMLERTRAWVLSRRDGKGGFLRNERTADSFGQAPPLTTDAYIVWALLQAGEKGLDKEINAVCEAAKASDDSYVLALAANICELTRDTTRATSFMTRLAKKQNKMGSVDGGVTSITRSGGEALGIETTALASLAWQTEKAFAGNAQASIQFLADSCKGGRFGSTQSTILALRAIVAYDQSQAHPRTAGRVMLVVDDKPWGEPIAFTADTKGAMAFPDFGSALPPGPHSVAVQMTDGSQMPFSMGINYNSTTPATDKQCKLDLSTHLKDAQLVEGGITEARVVVSNDTKLDAASPVAIIGIPGGLEVRHDQLKELVTAGKVDAYEVNGREVVLYWRQIKGGAKAEVSLSLTAAVPGTYSAPASRVYEYYTDEFKQWVDGSNVTISAK